MVHSTRGQVEWIATRVLMWHDQEVVIQIGAPYEHAEWGRWACRYRCVHAGQHVMKTFPGDDSLQALVAVIVSVGNHLAEHFPGATWDGTPHTGMPRWIPLLFVGTQSQADFEVRMLREIDAQIEEQFRRMMKERDE